MNTHKKSQNLTYKILVISYTISYNNRIQKYSPEAKDKK